ncbi:MAG: tRNA preQ1(34) S-adenosylmethionine ribosyltransferase-isomerase QueA [Patescibacteria group bacterium]
MLTSQFDYNLPKTLIGQKPIKPRDQARLLILDRKTKTLSHKKFYNLIDFLEKGDALVLNNSKVIPARLIGRKKTGGRIEVFLLKKIKRGLWSVLIKGKIKAGQKIILPKKIIATALKKMDGDWLVAFNAPDKKLFSIGQTPTPPYIKQKSNLMDYQTVYAKTDGSVAAPTAGLHFTKNLLKKLKNKGVKIEYITLHVGLGTFAPVKTEKIENHKMPGELAVLDKITADRLNKIKKMGHKIIVCGTTTVRTVEAFADKDGKLIPQKKWVDIFIYPGYKFKFVEAIITNFHLPKSTLLMLISAFANQKIIRRAYQEAINKKYRFYSFGDAMLIK